MPNSHFLHKLFPPEIFTEEELDQILPCFEKVNFKKNDYLQKAGVVANIYWIIETGFARAFVLNTDGDDISTHFYKSGDVAIDWSSFFLRATTKENIQALTDITCWQLDFNTFQRLFHSIEAFREIGRKRLVESYFELKNQSISMIADQAKDRYLKLVNDKPELIQNVSLKQIASYLGITDTSLSRIRKEISL